MTLVEILLLVAAVIAAGPHYLRAVRATAQGSLASCRFALSAPGPEPSGRRR